MRERVHKDEKNVLGDAASGLQHRFNLLVRRIERLAEVGSRDKSEDTSCVDEDSKLGTRADSAQVGIENGTVCNESEIVKDLPSADTEEPLSRILFRLVTEEAVGVKGLRVDVVLRVTGDGVCVLDDDRVLGDKVAVEDIILGHVVRDRDGGGREPSHKLLDGGPDVRQVGSTRMKRQTTNAIRILRAELTRRWLGDGRSRRRGPSPPGTSGRRGGASTWSR